MLSRVTTFSKSRLPSDPDIRLSKSAQAQTRTRARVPPHFLGVLREIHRAGAAAFEGGFTSQGKSFEIVCEKDIFHSASAARPARASEKRPHRVTLVRWPPCLNAGAHQPRQTDGNTGILQLIKRLSVIYRVRHFWGLSEGKQLCGLHYVVVAARCVSRGYLYSP